MNDVSAEIAERGYAIIPGAVDDLGLSRLLTEVESVCVRTKRNQGGIRNLLDRVPAVRQLADSAAVRTLLMDVLGPDAFVVRGILFDKTPESNWKVPWHQDLTIAVESRVEAEGYGPWTVKEGVWHVQPPASVLESMLSVRIHLDDCGEENGPLRVIARSHLRGRLSAEEIHSLSIGVCETCVVDRGGVVLMRPLLVHASSAARSPAHRRVIHLDFASAQLAHGLRWCSRG